MRRFFAAVGLGLALVMPGAALASSGKANDNVTLAKGDNRTGTYYAAGQTVTVDGNVDGDVVCAGQSVIVNGAVNGDVLCAGQEVTVNGSVTGSVRVVGQLVTVNGTVGRNVTVGGQNVVLGTGSRIGGELAAGGQNITINGPVVHDALIGANSLLLGAEIGGNLNYMSDQTFAVDRAMVKGDIVRHAPPKGPSPQSDVAARLGSLLFWVIGGLAVMLAAVWVVPGLVRNVTTVMAARPGASLGWGALATLAGPPLLLVLAITVIGIPLAIILGTLWIMVIMTSGLFAGVAVGRLALGSKEKGRRQLALAVLTGVPLVLIVEWLPWIGGLVSIVAVAWAMGGAVLSISSER